MTGERGIHEQIVDRLGREQARAPKSSEWRKLEAELEASGMKP
jgi:hypothetical protein